MEEGEGSVEVRAGKDRTWEVRGCSVLSLLSYWMSNQLIMQ